MMKKIEATVKRGAQSCIEAPNGFGKTVATLCGVLPWITENRGKILYCARTHRQLDRVMEELEGISEHQPVTGVSFRGRNHMCLNSFVVENAGVIAPVSEVCRHLKAERKCVYYEYIRKAGGPEELLEEMPFKVLKAPDIVKIAKIRSYCPYELAKQLAKVVDVVALSYLYVFDPFILETFIPELETPTSRIVLVEDEAHNVPSTALNSASDSLTVGTMRQAMREATTYNDSKSKNFCRELISLVLDFLGKMKQGSEKKVNPREILGVALIGSEFEDEDDLIAHLLTQGASIRRALLKSGKFPRSSIFRLGDFMSMWLRTAEREDYMHILNTGAEGQGSVKASLDLVALDPTAVTRPILQMVHSTIAISGTISPLDAYSEMLGLSSEAITATFQNPFVTSNRLGMIIEDLDTSYRNRTDSLFEEIVHHCVAVAHATPGNTGIFAPSYSVAKAINHAGLESRLRCKLFTEKPRMKSSENDRMISEFKEFGVNGGAVLLGVQGGRNSEGGDFPGPEMDSVIVVGVPYAKPTLRTEALIEYYNKKFNGKGRDYAYVMPAMTRAIQAAGRPVRKSDDKGAIILLDQRFGTPYLRRFFPIWLRDVIQVVPNDPVLVSDQLHRFFSS